MLGIVIAAFALLAQSYEHSAAANDKIRSHNNCRQQMRRLWEAGKKVSALDRPESMGVVGPNGTGNSTSRRVIVVPSENKALRPHSWRNCDLRKI